MKKIIYILSVMLLTVLAACTEDSMLPQEPDSNQDGYVTLRFTLEDIPDFKEVGTKAGETEVSSLSLMTFDESGNFLGRVEATNIIRTESNTNGSAKGTATASIPVNTNKIHFIANYSWNGTEYVTPQAGQTETTIMPALTTSSPNVAWGRVDNITDYQNVSVTLLRNYAKVTVTSDVPNFEVGGFALVNFVNKGTVVTWKENGETFDNVTNTDNSQTKITQVADYADNMSSQTSADCQNIDPKYLFEYENDYYNQTCVIIKKKDVEQYYKIQLIDSEGLPFKIERNYIYKVVIVKFAPEATGSPTFNDAVKAAPTNNIYAEVTKDAPTVSDADGNKLTVTPLAQLFTTSGTATFNAKYWLNNTLSLQNINFLVQADANHLLSTDPSISGNDGTVNVEVSKPEMQDGDIYSATILVKAGILSRMVTIYVSNQYSFEPLTGGEYSKVGDKVTLTFNIPDKFPKELFPLKCKIEANDLNPDNTSGQKQMLIEHQDGKYYYIYEAQATGQQTLLFVTTRSTVENPTISNEYFETGVFEMTKNVASQDVSGTLQYATSSSNGTNIPRYATVSWSCGNQNGTFSVGNNGSYTISQVKAEDSDQITFSYTQNRTNGYVEYEGTFKVSELQNKAVSLQPKRIVGTLKGNQSGSITVNKSWSGIFGGDNSGGEYGSISVKDGYYYYTLPGNFEWDQKVRIYQNSVKSDRLSISDWVNKVGNLNMTLK